MKNIFKDWSQSITYPIVLAAAACCTNTGRGALILGTSASEIYQSCNDSLKTFGIAIIFWTLHVTSWQHSVFNLGNFKGANFHLISDEDNIDIYTYIVHIKG